ncbi:MAG: HNH endonuclease, partial [Chloroflexota bacterium]|nr:HNH endonuclease [Chloroflexota bacterium]
MIERYEAAFSKLHSDKTPARWTADTNHRAPHKPFLLLAAMDLIAQGVVTTNFIELNADLMDTFDLYWAKVMGQEKGGSALLPFYHLKSEGFWHLVPVPGNEQLLSAVNQIRSFRQMRQLVLGATLDDALFELLTNQEVRD